MILPDWLKRDNRSPGSSSVLTQGGTRPAMIATQEATVHQPEDSVLARCREGDLDAYGQVYAEHERHVFRYAYHLLGHSEDADDVKQETFLRAFQAISGFRSECSLRTWLLRICANLCRDRMKARERKPEVLFDPLASGDTLAGETLGEDPHAVVERSHDRQLIRRALRGLPVDQRDIIVLRDMQDLSYEEISEIFGCSRASVKLRLFRARRRLKERVESLMTLR